MSLYSNKTLREGVGLLFAATLEVWAHHILYVRRVYPQETFGSTEYQGITNCKACRHPEVVSYIHDTVQTAVPALLRGTATEISLRIVERDDITDTILMEWEVYTLRMLDLKRELMERAFLSSRNSHLPSKGDLLHQLERGLRNLILKVQGLLHGHVATTNSCLDHLSFELSLNVPKEDRDCTRLDEGFKCGTWSEISTMNHSNLQQPQQEPPIKNLGGESYSLTHSHAKTACVLCPIQLVDTELCRVDFSLTRTSIANPSS